MLTRLHPRPSPDLRCAVCHDTLQAEAAACPGCATQLHPECWGLLRGPCPTRGCRGAGLEAGDLRARNGAALVVLLAWLLCGLAVWALPEAQGMVDRFDQLMSLVVWVIAGPLLGVVALDCHERRSG